MGLSNQRLIWLTAALNLRYIASNILITQSNTGALGGVMPVPKKVIPINRPSRMQEVYTTLLDWITEGKLHPGEKLLDKDVAQKLGVSRTPVREAFRRLEDKGLLETSAGCWTRVSPISLTEADQIYPVISKLEELVVSLSLNNLSAADFTRLENTNAALAAAIKSNHPVKASQADYRFHQILIEKSNNPYVIGILKDLKIQFRRLEVHYFGGAISASDSVNEHKRLLEALREGNSERAQQMIGLNWKSSMKRIRKTSDQK
jgi:DNA-binding GntR family transcriptional regulator